jgi:hypothetical protein
MSNTDEKFVHKYVSIEPLNKKFLKVKYANNEFSIWVCTLMNLKMVKKNIFWYESSKGLEVF